MDSPPRSPALAPASLKELSAAELITRLDAAYNLGSSCRYLDNNRNFVRNMGQVTGIGRINALFLKGQQNIHR